MHLQAFALVPGSFTLIPLPSQEDSKRMQQFTLSPLVWLQANATSWMWHWVQCRKSEKRHVPPKNKSSTSFEFLKSYHKVLFITIIWNSLQWRTSDVLCIFFECKEYGLESSKGEHFFTLTHVPQQSTSLDIIPNWSILCKILWI